MRALPLVALVLSVLGIAGFIFLFVRDFNVYWLILSPVIFIVYQFPAFVVFWIYRKRRDRREERIGQDPSLSDDQEKEDRTGEDL